MKRKFRRDISGVSGYRILRPRLVGIVTKRFWRNSLRFYLGQLAIFFALRGRWKPARASPLVFVATSVYDGVSGRQPT